MADQLAISLVLTADARDQLAKLAQVKQATRDTYDSATQTITRASASSATAVRNATSQMASDQQKAASGFAGMAKAALGIGGAVAGFVVVQQALAAVAEQTQKANQAQFALNATYRGAAGTFTAFAAQHADVTKRTVSEVQATITAFGSLSNRYGVTTEQVKELTKRSADLAAVKGITTVEAAQRLEAALRGEAESAEFLGLTLNSDYLKKFATMTAEQRKNWETLDPLIKAQITYAEVLKQTDPLLGTAAKRTNEAAGASDRLKTAQADLAITIGKGLNPTLNEAAGLFAGLTVAANDYLKKIHEIEQQGGFHGLNAENAAAASARIQVGPDEGLPGFGRGTPTPAQIDAASAGRSAIAAAAAERRSRAKAELDAADKANDATVESAIKAIDAERKAKERWYGEERQRVEARRTYQLEDIEARKDAELDRIKMIAEAQKDADKAAIEDAERRKRVELDAIQEATDQTIKALDARKDELTRTRQVEDRERADAQRSANAQIKAARDAEDHERETSHRDETRRRADQHEAAVEALKDEQEAREEASRKALRGIEEEADAERKNSDRALRNLDRRSTREDDRHRKALTGIERQGDAEDDRHRRAMESLDDERDAQLSILDVQLRALDAAERSEDSAARTSDLQQRLSRAQQALTAAQGTGTPGEVAGGIQDLSQALRTGSDVSIANARERLAKLAGQGAEAIKKAQEDVADAERALREESVKQTRDAERQKLKDAQDAIRSKSDAEKEAEDERNRQRKAALDADKDAEDERSRLRKEGFAADRQAEQDKLKDRLEALDERKAAEQEASRTDLEGIRARVEAEGKAHDDAVRLANDEYTERTRLLGQRREQEDAALEALRLAADREREDNRAAEDADLGVQRANAAANQEAMRKDTEVHYSGPNGIITQLRKASEDHAREHSAQLATATAAFAAERKAAELIYTNPEGTGLLQNLEKARASEFEKLEASKTEWEAWGKAASAAIKAAMGDLDAFIARGANIPRIGGDVEAQRSPGSGKLTSSSSSATRSGKSGKEVQGDLASWLNDAMDLTGVGNDWTASLFKLAQLESGGDPHNKNASGASGLMQMMPGTFKAYRDHNLPNDIFDPVANAVASIRYIQQEYLTGNKTGSPADINWIVANHARRGGYDAGGLITEPSYLLSMRTNRIWSSIAEHGPEMVTGRAQTAAQMGGFDEDRLVRVMARAVAASRPIVMNGTSEDLYRKVRRHLDQNSREHDSLRRRS